MKTVQIKIYEYSELSEKAKESAKAWINEEGYIWENEAINSLNAFFKELDLKLTRFDIDWDNPIYCKVYYSGEPNGQFIKKDLTGYCMDYSLTETWNKTRSVQSSVGTFFNNCAKDYRYQWTDEYCKEHCEANQYYFYADGSFFYEK